MLLLTLRIVKAILYQKDLEVLKHKSKKTIIDFWRRYRFRSFYSTLHRFVDEHRIRMHQCIQQQEKAFRIRTTHRRLQEDHATQRWVKQEAKLSRLIPREQATTADFHEQEEIRARALADFVRADLNPFSSNVCSVTLG